MDLDKLSKLADLELSVEEKKELKPQLEEVLEYIDLLSKVDVTSVEPTSQTTGLVDITKSDEINVERVLDQSSATSNTDNTHNDYFVVSALLDKDSG